MKRNAIVRIVIYSIILVLLVVLLLDGLGVGTLHFGFAHDSKEYQIGGSSVSAESIRNLDIYWTSGDVVIRTGDTDTITFEEEGDSSEHHQMVYNISADSLSIRYEAPGIRIQLPIARGKNLIVTVPADWVCSTLKIEVASAALTVEGIRADNIAVETASGNCDFVGCDIKNVDINSASGDISYTGSLVNLKCDTASARFYANIHNLPRRMEIDCASGDYDITLPSDAEFWVDMDVLNGTFHSDFDTEKEHGAYICGDGSCYIKFDGASGKLTIRKGK